MYDYLITVAESIYKNGISAASLGVALFALLKTRIVKRKIRRFIPWAMDSDSEVKEYVRNQQLIMEALNIKWNNGAGSKEPYTATNLTRSSTSSQEGTSMKNYLKKLSRTKLQAYLLTTIINLALLIGYILDVQDIQEKVEAWTPLINATLQTVLTWAYIAVEGKIDAEKVKNGGSGNGTDFTQDAAE